jgi:uncharacterized protein YjdB
MKKFMFLSTILVGLTACSEDLLLVEPIMVDPLVVELTPSLNSSTTVQAGNSSQLAVLVNGGPLEFTATWRCSTSNEAVAVAVDNQVGCRVTGVGVGNATVTATVTRGIYTSIATTRVTVTPNPSFIPVPSRVNVLLSTSGFVRDTLQARAVSLTSTGDTIRGLAVSWTSSNTAVATVSPLGVVTLVSAGRATISATVAGVTGTSEVTSNLVPVQSVSLVQSGGLFVGRTASAVPTVVGVDGNVLPLTQRNVVWRSNNTAVATVDSRGVVSGVSVGSARILLTVDGEPASLDVVVTRVGIDKVTLTPDTTTMVLGTTRQFVARAFDVNGVEVLTPALDGRVFEWSTVRADNTNSTARLVTSSTGLVTATGVGSARVRARVDGVSGFAVVTVTEP